MFYALTFDDGPGPSTGTLLDVLDKAGIKGTFFMLGDNIESPVWASREVARKLVVRALKAGHQVGNHSFSHPGCGVNPETFLDELDRMDTLINSLRQEAGLPADPSILVRLPFGPSAIDSRVEALTRRQRLHTPWTYLFDDWVPRDWNEMVQEMITHVAHHEPQTETAVLLLHDGSSNTSIQGDLDRTHTVLAVSRFLEIAFSKGWESRGIR